jgi:hypothetical protein
MLIPGLAMSVHEHHKQFLQKLMSHQQGSFLSDGMFSELLSLPLYASLGLEPR